MKLKLFLTLCFFLTIIGIKASDDIIMSSSATYTVCSAKFYDAGGPSGDYMNNQNTTLTVYPATPGAKLSVSFNTFKTQTQYISYPKIIGATDKDDILYVYDGNSTDAPQIGAMSGVGYGPVTSTAADGSLTFKFVSYAPYNTPAAGERAGWSATIDCGGLASIFGVITNIVTGLPVQGAVVKTLTYQSAPSDASGKYVLEVPYGNGYELTVISPSYETAIIQNVNVPASNPLKEVNIQLVPTITDDGLVAYYPFNGNANDESGNGNNGISYGNPESVNGKKGMAFSFDGSNYVEIPHSDVFNISKAITISLWAKEYSNTPGYSSLIYKAGEEPTGTFNDRVFSLWTTNDLGIHFTSTPNGSTSQNICNTPSNSYISGEFVHIVAVIDAENNKTMTIYINGIKKSTCIYVGNIRSGNYPLRIGGHFHTLGDQFNFNGIIDEVSIYNRALTEQEIQKLYESTSQSSFWAENTSGGIAVQVIEIAGTNKVQFVGYEYLNPILTPAISEKKTFKVTDSQAFIVGYPAPPDITKFKSEIILYDEFYNKIGHIPYQYNSDTESDKCRHAILFFHNDDDMCKDGDFPYGPKNPFYPKKNETPWEYFKDGEYPVSMLIPPRDNMSKVFDKKPILFVHGMYGTYPYWKPTDTGNASTVDLVNDKEGYDAWQIYYPKDMDIFHSAKCLKNDIEYLKSKLYNNDKINVVTHSMGGLVTAEYITTNPTYAKYCVGKVLMIEPPIHGTLGSNLFYKSHTLQSAIAAKAKEWDRQAPCFKDISLGSKFVTDLHQRDWSSLLNKSWINDSIFVLIGTTKEKATNWIGQEFKSFFGEEAINHNDVLVSISSASLLDHEIGFATMHGNHEDGKNINKVNGMIENKSFLPDFIDTYFKTIKLSDFTDKIIDFDDIKVIVNPNKSVIKPINCSPATINKINNGCSTGEKDVDYQKGLLQFEIPRATSGEYYVYRNKGFDKIILTRPVSYPLDFQETWIYFGHINRNPYSNLFYFTLGDFGNLFKIPELLGCAIPLKDGEVSISSDISTGLNLHKIFNFNSCETFRLSLESNLLASNNNGQSIIKRAYLWFRSLNKDAIIQSGTFETITDTVVYIDDQIQAVNFTLQSWEANENGIPITMKLKMPDGTELDPNSSNLIFSIDSVSGLHQMLINNPMTGTWHIWAETSQPAADTMQYVARAYFLSDIIAYNVNDTDKVIEGKSFSMEAGLKFKNLILLDTASTKVMATVTAPNGKKQVYNISKKISQTDTSFVFSGLIPTDTMGYHTVEITFEGTYNGFKFERALVFQFEGLDNKVYFNLPYVEMNENKRFTELQLSKFVQSYAANYDTARFTQRIISSSVDTSAYKVVLDSLQRNAIIYSSISDTGMVNIEYAFPLSKDFVMKDTMQVFINQIYPHSEITTSTTDLCLDNSATLMATGGDTIKWSTGESTSSIIVNPTLTTLYKVTVGRNGYFTEDSIKVTVITSPETAGLITGDTTVTQGVSKVYKVPEIIGATTYEWTLPSGATGTSTADTIKVDFGLNAVAGKIKVKGINKCGEGIESSFDVIVKPSPVPSITVGNKEIYSLVSTAANRRATPVTFDKAGTIQSISIYHNGGKGNVLLGVYADLNGLPSSQLGITALTVVNSTSGWQTVELTSPVTVTSGQKVWLAWVFQNSIGVRYASGAPGRMQSIETWSAGMPATFGTATFGNNKFSIYCTYTPVETITATLGNTEVYSTTSTTAYRRAMPVMISEAGTIQSISIYHNGGKGNVLLGVYSDQSGSPASLLGVTASTVINSTAGWQTVALTNPVALTQGQKVWLAWVFQNSIGVRYASGSPGRMQSTETWSAGMPATFGTATFGNNKFSIYCTYTPGVINKESGNTEVYTTTSTAAYRRAMPVTFNEAGTIRSISIYHNGGKGNVLLGVYDDQSGSPASLLGLTASTVVNSAAGWQTVTLTNPVTVTQGQKVWLAWIFQNSIGIRYASGAPGRMQSTETWSAGMPAAFGAATFGNNKFSIYCTYTPAETITATLGNTEVYSTTSAVAYRRATPVTLSEAGTIQSISIYHNGGKGNVLLGVYADQNGSPASLLGVTTSTVINSTSGWQTIPLTSTVAVTSGQKVWLSWVFQNNIGVRYATGAPGRMQSTETWSVGMPATFGTATFGNNKFSVYCTYIPGATKSAEVVSPHLEASELKVYPNPFSDKINFEFVSANDTHAVLEIYNLLGQSIVRLLDQQVEAGVMNRIEYAPNQIISGVYIYKLTLDGKITVGKVIYQKKQ
jgi:pimeloyl-ACP methyl ester carboxylesterase